MNAKSKDYNEIDFKLLEAYLSRKKLPFYRDNKITPFSNVGRIYPFTNEPLSLYKDGSLNNKKVLSVTSSGDHILHALLKGAKDITGFDINVFCKYYSALKIAMIKKYNYEEFFEKLNYIINYLDNYDWIFNKSGLIFFEKIICEVEQYLTCDELSFFKTFIDIGKKINITLPFFYDKPLNYDEKSQLSNSDYFIKKNYYLLKQKLDDCSIKYVDSNLNELNKKQIGTFDAIYLSNILDTVFENKEKLVVYLRNLLKKDGVLYDCSWSDNSYAKHHKINKFFNVYCDNLKDGHILTTFVKK